MPTISVLDSAGVAHTIAKVASTGQNISADSFPVVISSDQSAIPISALSLPLPAGAATNATLTSIYNSVSANPPTDVSGAITTGGTAQILSPYDSNRKGFSIYNSSSADLWINFTGINASNTSGSAIKLVPGALYESPTNMKPISMISVFGATTGQTFSAQVY